MTRIQIILTAIILALVGAVLPVAIMFWVSWSLTMNDEQRRVGVVADRVVTRANRAVREAQGAMQAMIGIDMPKCSPAHINMMRRQVLNTQSIGEMGYFENGKLKCTSWGLVGEIVPETKPDFITDDGISITTRLQPLLAGGNSMMGIRQGSYDVLVDPTRLVDVITDPGIELAIVSSRGQTIASLNDPDPALVNLLFANRRSSFDNQRIFATSLRNGFTAIAIEPRNEILATLRREQIMLLTVGGFIALTNVGTVIWFSRRRLSPRTELLLAIGKKEFIVHYQPIIRLSSGICIGAEALVRWRRPDGELVRPDLFIPLAEENRCINAITDQVVENVFHDLGEAMIADRSLHVSINVSAEDLGTGRLLAVLQPFLVESGVNASQVWFEATERGFIDVQSAREMLSKARENGHSVAMDDFGTGYSNLQNLQILPIDALKIDKAFVDTIGKEAATSSVIDHIIDLAKALRLFVIAEGVEEKYQADYLRARDVLFAQGWLFARALPSREYLEFLAENRLKYRSGELLSSQ